MVSFSHVDSSHIEIEERPWQRVDLDGSPHPHTFVGSNAERYTCTATASRGENEEIACGVKSGLKGLLLLKTSNSGFAGFLQDRFTTLPETDDRILATTVAAELGDLTRFAHPTPLMAFTGLVPSESSSGERQRRGGITKTGNQHVRRVLVESAWAYRHPARVSKTLLARQEGLPQAVCDVAWRAQLMGWRCLYVPHARGYHVRTVRPGNRRGVPAAINMHSGKNRFLMRIKNISSDLWWRNCMSIMARDITVVGCCLLWEHTSLKAFWLLAKGWRRVVAKRREIQRRRRASPAEIAAWFSYKPVSHPAPKPQPHHHEVAAARVVKR